MTRDPSGFRVGDRAVVPSVEKSLEATIVVLYVALLTATLFGGVVPDLRTTAGDEVADRALASAGHQVEAGIPSEASVASAHVRIDLPDRIRGEGYRVHADGRSLELDHPDAGVGTRTHLAVPDRVVAVEGTWHSQLATAAVVEPAGDGVAVRLVSGPAATDDGQTVRDGGGDGDGSPPTRTPPDDRRRRGGR